MSNPEYVFENLKIINFINLSAEEKEKVRKWRNHPKIKQWMNHRKTISFVEHQQFLTSLEMSKNNKYWLVKQKEQYLGVIYFTDITSLTAELGIYISPDQLGHGYGSLLLKYLLKIGFEKIGLKNIKLEVFSDNTKAINLYQKFHFKIMPTNDLPNKASVVKKRKLTKMTLESILWKKYINNY
jgi:UDP-4-amino-4,6-dideoxy-N-acetyl-beta-L-altrosamine N-acetyltransferase